MKRILLIITLMVFIFGGGSNGFATETEETAKEKECKITDELSGLTIISGGKAQMRFSSTISVTYSDSLWNDLFILKNKTEIRDIDIYFYCLGGDMFAGFAIIERIREAKKNGFIFTAYATGAVGSMAIPIYACCTNRVAYHSTVFMVHPTALGTAKFMLTGADLQSQTDLYNMTQDQYVSVLAEFTNLSKEEWLKKIEKDTWFSAEQAKEWGLVDRID